jgi:hypothetical protein
MGGTLPPVTDKLDWAKQKVRVVRERIERFQEAEGRPFRAELDPRAGSKQAIKVLWSPATTGTMPLDDLAHSIGDAVHNLRGTLDYLIYQLHLRNLTGPEPENIPLGDPLRKTGFPVFLDENEFEGKGKGGPGATKMLAGITDDQRARIKKLQPFGDPDHPLWVLSELDNLDKHRHAHVLLRLDRVWLDPRLAHRFGFRTVEGVKPGRRYEEGAKVTVLTQHIFDPAGVQAQVNVALKRKLSVLFDKGSPAEGRDVVTELRRIQSTVTRIVNGFRWEFPPPPLR